MGRADAPLLLDVWREEKFLESPSRAGALHCAPEKLAAFAATRPLRAVVVYCVYGHNASEDAVATLRAASWNAHMLAGGIEGGEEGIDTAQDIAEWRTHRPLIVLKRPDWGVTGEQASRWIARERPKIDRIACPWLIRRFIDPRAEFFYVPTAQVLHEAKNLGAVAFDIPGAPVSHESALCSFDVLLREFALVDPALATLARIVRGADTDQLELAPQSAGLPLYDALYAWCRTAQDEPHSWKPETMLGAGQ